MVHLLGASVFFVALQHLESTGRLWISRDCCGNLWDLSLICMHIVYMYVHIYIYIYIYTMRIYIYTMYIQRIHAMMIYTLYMCDCVSPKNMCTIYLHL